MDAIQDKLPDNNCYGCGPNNAAGMRIKSHWDGDECICRYMPKPEQCAGPPQFVYGGTIASLIDCHGCGAAMSNYYRLEGRKIGDDPEIWCVTVKLTVNYSHPTPINTEIELRAKVTTCTEKKSIVHCTVWSGGLQTADGEVIAVRVSQSWKQG
jgi:acyl-coenzyme A thioesterase PaaI-like protein